MAASAAVDLAWQARDPENIYVVGIQNRKCKLEVAGFGPCSAYIHRIFSGMAHPEDHPTHCSLLISSFLLNFFFLFYSLQNSDFSSFFLFFAHAAVCDAEEYVRLLFMLWGRGGMITFLVLAEMVDTTPVVGGGV